MSDIDIRSELLNNIVLSGGTTMYKGFAERLSKELNLKNPRSKIRVSAPPER